jgi:putative hemolysin
VTEAITLPSHREEADSAPVTFSYSRPEQRWLNRTLIHIVEHISGQPYLERLYREWAQNHPKDENIFAASMRLLEIDIDTDAGAWARVPKSGPILFVANHPFGVIDGLLMGHLAAIVRPDTKILTHSLLCQIPEAREFLLPVDFGGTTEAVQRSAQTRRRSVDWLKQGHAVALFPAGSVSTSQHPFRGPVLDTTWHPFAAKLALLPNVTVIPVCFHGQNSRLFQIASHLHYALRVALLFRESCRLRGTRIKVSVGEPVSSNALGAFGSRDAVVKELRRRTLSLREAGSGSPMEEFRWPSHISFD